MTDSQEELKAFIRTFWVMLSLFVILCSITIAMLWIEKEPLNPIMIDYYSDNNVTGVAIYKPTICIPMEADNIESLKNISDHEFLHQAIELNLEYRENETYKQHFCGGK